MSTLKQRDVVEVAAYPPPRRQSILFRVLLWLSASVVGLSLPVLIFWHRPAGVTIGLSAGVAAGVAGAAVAYLLLHRAVAPWIGALPRPQRAIWLGAALAIGWLAWHQSPFADASVLVWRAALGPQRDEPMPVFPGSSWGVTEPALIELHANVTPEQTDFGLPRVTVDLAQQRFSGSAQIQIRLAQPGWAVIDPGSNAVSAGVDGVLVLFLQSSSEGERLLAQFDLDPRQPDRLGWQTVTLPVAPGTQALTILLEPKGTINSDRVWISQAQISDPLRWSASGAGAVLAGFVVVVGGAALGILRRRPRVEAAWRSAMAWMGRYGWFVSAVGCLVVGYLLVWQRGGVLDDFALKSLAIDPISGERQPLFVPENNPNYPARMLTWMLLPQFAALLPDQTLLARVLMALLTGANALLIGLLAKRMLGSQLAGIVAGWLFLIPIFTDVPYWIGAGAYLIVTLLLLLSLHSAWSLFTVPTRPWLHGTLIVAAFVLAMQFAENAIILPPLVSGLWLAALGRNRQISARLSLIRLGAILGAVVGALAAIYLTLYTGSAVVRNREGLDLHPLRVIERAGVYAEALMFWVVQPDWGGRILGEALALGYAELFARPAALAAMLLTILACWLTVIAFSEGSQQADSTVRRSQLLVLLFGLILFATSFLYPYTLARSQGFERRYLYLPTAGLAITLSSLGLLLSSGARRRVLQRAVLSVAAVLMVLTAVVSLGYSRVYAVRTVHDQRQIEALRRDLPATVIPQDTVLVAYGSDEQLFAQPTLIDPMVVGQFEAPWSAYHGVLQAYRRDDLSIIVTSRWAPMYFAYPAQNGDQTMLTIQGKNVPIVQALLYQFRDDTIYVIESITLEQVDGGETTLTFPIAQELARVGVLGIPNVVVQNGATP